MNNIEQTCSVELGSLFGALSKAQGRIENALKDKKNPFFKSSYADLASVWEVCRDPLSTNGLAIIQTIEGTKEGMYLNTWIGHSSGQWMKSKLPLIVMKQDPQSVGSAITYARRYALSALVGICADEDDDGEKAMGRKSNKEEMVRHDVFVIDDPAFVEKKMEEFLTPYPKEDHELIRSYIKKYASHWKKTISVSLKENENREKFELDFVKWKKKEIANISKVENLQKAVNA